MKFVAPIARWAFLTPRKRAMRTCLILALVALLVAVGAPLRVIAAECAALAPAHDCDCCAPAPTPPDKCDGTCELDEAPAVPADRLVASSSSHLRVVDPGLFRPTALRLPASPSLRPQPRGEPPITRPSSVFPSQEPTRGPPVRA